jgi:hypothetical protein
MSAKKRPPAAPSLTASAIVDLYLAEVGTPRVGTGEDARGVTGPVYTGAYPAKNRTLEGSCYFYLDASTLTKLVWCLRHECPGPRAILDALHTLESLAEPEPTRTRTATEPTHTATPPSEPAKPTRKRSRSLQDVTLLDVAWRRPS